MSIDLLCYRCHIVEKFFFKLCPQITQVYKWQNKTDSENVGIMWPARPSWDILNSFVRRCRMKMFEPFERPLGTCRKAVGGGWLKTLESFDHSITLQLSNRMQKLKMEKTNKKNLVEV